MKHLVIFIFFTIFMLISCGKETSDSFVLEAPKAEKPIETLPFSTIELNDLSDFKPTGDNWQIVGRVFADRDKMNVLTPSEGKGILLNANNQDENQHVFTAFEHGDMELELSVMMPEGSNSGLYFQSRYEVQLLDSWGVEHPNETDMGGVYHRWDNSRGKGNEGYDGTPPSMNAAKAPGLWQHLKIIFHAPKFDADGKKIKNASFEEVWLNGVLVQHDVELTGPTRAAAFDDEMPTGALMIQGDHGPVAIKNIKYKLYDTEKVTFSDLIYKEYESNSSTVKSLDSLKLINESRATQIDLLKDSQSNAEMIMAYSGQINIPSSGKYLFDMRLNGGAVFIIDKDTVLNLNQNNNFDDKHLRILDLEKGTTSFSLFYNKISRWHRGFEFFVEGDKMQRYSIQEPEKLLSAENNTMNFITLEPTEKTLVQRSFFMHDDIKRTHCISVGSPEKVHYAFDLQGLSLLKVWYGSFLNTTHMWHSRGEHQIGEPGAFSVRSHGDVEFVKLNSDASAWPVTMPEDADFKQLGYEFNSDKLPVFSHRLYNSLVTNTFIPSKEKRHIKRSITINGTENIWHKIADGERIEVLKNDIYVINNESYFIDFSENSLKAVVRKSNGKDELVVEIPSGEHAINYSIIW